MSLQYIKDNCLAAQESHLPIEADSQTKPLQKRELDQNLLFVTYFDSTHQMMLPVFAAASVESEGGCILKSVLPEKINHPALYEINSGNLSGKLPALPEWKNEHQETQERKPNRIPLFIIYGVICCLLTALISAANQIQGASPIGVFSTLFISTLLTAFLAVIGNAVGLNQKVLKDFNPNTVAFRDYHQKTYTKIARSSLPGKLPDDIKDLINQESSNYEDIHLLWSAMNTWEFNDKPPKYTDKPESDLLVFGEDKKGRYIFLGDGNCVPQIDFSSEER